MSHPAEHHVPERQPRTDAHGMPIVPTLNLGQDNSGGHQGIHVTWLLSTANPVQLLVPRDYDRLECRVISTAGPTSPAGFLVTTAAPIVIAQSKEIAEVAAQAGVGFGGPGGAFLPASLERTFRNCDEIWAAWLGIPAMVSVSISRRLPDEKPPQG
jgi:hypothetical protein